MTRVTKLVAMVLFLAFFKICQASIFMGYLDFLFGFGSNKADMMHKINGILSCREHQCRLALTVKDSPNVQLLMNVLPPLEELVTENKEFLEELSNKERIDMLGIYLKNLHSSKVKPLDGKPFDVIMTILSLDMEFDLMKLALDRKILSEQEVLIFFLKHLILFKDAIKAGILDHLDITSPILAGKGVLHVLAESGESELCIEILDHFNARVEYNVKYNHFTAIEGNSILHSAVLSNSTDLIFYLARHYNCLCGHRNRFGLSPLKLALMNRNGIQSVSALLEFGCSADGKELLNEVIDLSNYSDYSDFNENLEKFAKWAPRAIENFRLMLNDACSKIIDGQVRRSSIFFGILNSYRQLNFSLDRILDGDLIASPSIRSRSRTLSSLQSNDSPRRVMKRQPSLWSILSAESFDETSVELYQPVVVATIIDGMNFNFCEDGVKSRVLMNLSKLKSLDYTGCTLTRLIFVLISYAEPHAFAHFVNQDIDYYFCIRSIFKQSKNYEKLVPYLDAIGFDGNKPFVDGQYPIHFAVQSGNITLVEFLMETYNVSLHTLTKYEKDNVLHFGLGDRSNSEMSGFLLNAVPELLTAENAFGISPIQQSLMTTTKFECFTEVLKIRTLQTGEAFSEEIMKLFNDLLDQWPKNSGSCENGSKEKFVQLFNSCGSEETARFLLGFLLRKLLEHLIKAKSLSSLSSFSSLESLASRHGIESPNSIVISLSPMRFGPKF